MPGSGRRRGPNDHTRARRAVTGPRMSLPHPPWCVIFGSWTGRNASSFCSHPSYMRTRTSTYRSPLYVSAGSRHERSSERPINRRATISYPEWTMRGITPSFSNRSGHSTTKRTGTQYRFCLPWNPKIALSLDRKALNHGHPRAVHAPAPPLGPPRPTQAPGDSTTPHRHSFLSIHPRPSTEHVTCPPPPTITPRTPGRTRPGLGQNSSRTRHLQARIAVTEEWELAETRRANSPACTTRHTA